ncbi:uncharacterized protein Dana_GF22271 [Drosophila ananassae]|uniref:non-specific serine/threonine protein kinase n=2 Tax=Drosophila ananassae TaxID=7217 RepID=B3MZ58_DROAN|nr:uncharacterized protein Dana_GF22271 [Drosophila ananassae]
MPLGGAPIIPIGSPMAVMPTTPRAQKPRSKSEEAISDLLLRIPDIGILFDVHSRIGNGTFSTVLLATLRRESHLPDNVRRKFAIKHHIPTSHPDRIMKELQCMTKMGGTNNVVGIHCCLRCDASAAFVMPYMPHDRFHDFFTRMDVSEIRLYMRNLLIALRHVHKFDIIHRDVKPSNFLYNRRRREFLLVDFGLAQHVLPSMGSSSAGMGAVGKRSREADNEEQLAQHSMQGGGGGAAGAGIPMEIAPSDAELGGAVKRMRLEEGSKMPLKQINEIAQGEAPPADFGNPNNPGQQASVQQLQQPEQNYNAPGGGTASGSKYNTNRNAAGSGTKCFCFANPSVCLNCLMKKEVHASRAGTPGYRPPEVLLKYPDQTTAVDVWAAGVIFLSIMSSVYPFFKAPNDFVALAEIVTIFGDQAIRKTALALERMVTLSQRSRPLSLRKLCLRFRHRRVFSDDKLHRSHANQDGKCEVCRNCDQYYFNCLCEDSEYNDEPLDPYECFPASAYDLLHRLLEVNPHKRITAAEALLHPFFTAAEGQNQAATGPLSGGGDHQMTEKSPQAEQSASRKQRRQRYPKVAGAAAGNEQMKQQLELDVHASNYEKL